MRKSKAEFCFFQVVLLSKDHKYSRKVFNVSKFFLFVCSYLRKRNHLKLFTIDILLVTYSENLKGFSFHCKVLYYLQLKTSN